MFTKYLIVTITFTALTGGAFANTNPFAGPDTRAPAPSPPPPQTTPNPPAPPGNVTPLPTPNDFPTNNPSVTPRTNLPELLKQLIRNNTIPTPPAPPPITLTTPNPTLPITSVPNPTITPITDANHLNHLRAPYPDQILRTYLHETPTALIGTVTSAGTTAIFSIAGVTKRIREGDHLPNSSIRVMRVTEREVTLSAGLGTATLFLAGSGR